MSGAGELAVALLGALLLPVALGVVIYASLTRRHRRGYVASLVALALGLASAAMTLPIAQVPLYGCCQRGGDPFSPGLIAGTVVFMGVQALAVLAAILNALRHRRRIVPPPDSRFTG